MRHQISSNIHPLAVRLDGLSHEVLSYSQIDYRRLFVPFCGCLGAVGVGLHPDISYHLKIFGTPNAAALNPWEEDLGLLDQPLALE